MDEQRIIDAEIRIAYQEQALEAMNGALLAQQEEIRRLSRIIERIQGQLEGDSPSYGPANDKPPHW